MWWFVKHIIDNLNEKINEIMKIVISLEFDILVFDTNKFRLLIKESLFIKRDQP